ncbi:MAG: AmmeMemoRadiSam system protein B [Anaerolineae bacterium]
MKPKLRPVDAQMIEYQDRPVILLRDPLGLTEQVMLVPQPLGPLLYLCDGSRDLDQLRTDLGLFTGIWLSSDEIEDIISSLAQALFLEDDHFAEAYRQALAEFRAAPHRAPSCAGSTYPDDPDALRTLLQKYWDQAGEVEPLPAGQGLISPHIDYTRGGPVYAQVWKRAAEMARAADVAIILGTDHKGFPGRLTLTRQSYASPLGVLPTALDVVDAVAQAIGPEEAFGDELHHQDEHSVELAAVWLQFVRDGRPVELVPILCGSFQTFMENGDAPAQDPKLAAAIQAIKQATAGRRALYVAAGDLAHLGPAFDGEPLDFIAHAQIRHDDELMLNPILSGDSNAFFDVIRRNRNARNVCGVSSFYLALELMGNQPGEMVAYDRCPADSQNTSIVSICGVVFNGQEGD